MRLRATVSYGGAVCADPRRGQELRDALGDLIGHFDRSETVAWHANVSSSDFQREINVVAE